jgi:FixJ family two-component response regulator
VAQIAKKAGRWDRTTVAPRKVIAIVDDDSLMLQALTRLLRAQGFDVRGFSSAHAFVSDYAINEADCLVLDIGLTDMSGIELAKRMNADGLTVPIIFITGLNTEELQAEATETGCIGYLRKPFPAARLLEAIERAIP